MGLHKSFDRQFVLIGGAVMTNGGSLDLSRGEVGIFDIESGTTDSGVPAVSSFKGYAQERLFEIRYRENDESVSSRSRSSKTFKSFPFTLENVKSIRVSAPKRTEAQVDEVVVGYNGIDPSTAITFRRGEKKNASIELSGEAIGMLGYPNSKVTVPLFFDAGELNQDPCIEEDACSPIDCTKIVENGLNAFKQFKLRGGVSVEDYIEISPIRSCAPVETETAYKFYELTVCDTGDEFARALIRQQYPGIHIERIDRVGAFSTYQLLQPSASDAPAKYKQTLPSIIKGCKDCPTGYTASTEGLVYAITLEDNGADKTSVIEGLPNAIAGTGKKADGQEHGVGFYTVVLSKKLTKDQVKALVTAEPTVTLDFVGSVKAVCVNGAIQETAWIAGSELKLTERDFTINVPDANCSGLTNRLAELQVAYPNLTIELEGTTGGCQTRYKTKVKTNLRGAVCDPIFLDAYSAEAPLPFEGRAWQPVEVVTPGTNCLCGFKVKGKLMQIFPSECVIDKLAYVEDSVKIRVSGGWISDIREGIGRIEDDPFNVEYLSYAQKRTHLGYGLKNFENQSRTYFSGNVYHNRRNIEKFINGVESNLNYEAQYIDYAVTIKREQFAQSMSQKHDSHTTFHFQVEVGRHGKIEALLNSLAAQAGIKGVKAFGEVTTTTP